MFVVTLPEGLKGSAASSFATLAHERGAELLEVRGDLSAGIDEFPSPLDLLIRAQDGDLRALKNMPARYVDLDLETISTAKIAQAQAETSSEVKFILSYHNHELCPSSEFLLAQAAKAIKFGADILKISVWAQSFADLVRLDAVQAQIKLPNTVLVMGPLATINRLRSPWRNILSYFRLDGFPVSAPGQLSLDHRVCHMVDEPRIYAVISGPGLVSMSPKIHNRLFESFQENAVYTALNSSDLAADWPAIRALNMRGFSVTTPWKEAAAVLADSLSPLSQNLACVNTLVADSKGKFSGDQTDVGGFTLAQEELRNLDHVAILGSGGVVPALLESCLQLGIKRVDIYARSPKKARARFASHELVGAIQALPAFATCDAQALVWSIPVDLPELSWPEISAEKPRHAIDLRYAEDTQFLRKARELGCSVENGSAMLVCQALAQFEQFTNRVLDDETRASWREKLLETF